MLKKILIVLLHFLFISAAFAQTGEIRGFVFEKESGEPMVATNVIIKELKVGKTTDENGFYTLSKVIPGTYTLMCFSMGYDTAYAKIILKAG